MAESTERIRERRSSSDAVIKLKTVVFQLYNEKYATLSELAHAMGISVSQVYRVRKGKRSVNEKFIVGAIKAFPGYRFNDLFYVAGNHND